MGRNVLNASAMLALLLDEPDSAAVEDAIEAGPTLSTVSPAVALAARGLFLTIRSRSLSPGERDMPRSRPGERNQPDLSADRSWRDLAPVPRVTLRLTR